MRRAMLQAAKQMGADHGSEALSVRSASGVIKAQHPAARRVLPASWRASNAGCGPPQLALHRCPYRPETARRHHCRRETGPLQPLCLGMLCRSFDVFSVVFCRELCALCV